MKFNIGFIPTLFLLIPVIFACFKTPADKPELEDENIHFEDIYGTGIPLFIIPAAFVLVTGIFSMNFMLIIFSVLDIVCEYCSAYGVRKRLHPAKTEESSDEAETKENEDGE